ncbi:hypothetical protein Ahy_A06g030041 isoform C [Arachis hypogaea]|uniref:Secreted protein n=1 Tax=Arachis hypogaea TaxID=3818 RepID=A0A445CV35_ARAHY|nr:hypothetical protein Ahy_A06g030041 isoform C [Arachis hypogaea]
MYVLFAISGVLTLSWAIETSMVNLVTVYFVIDYEWFNSKSCHVKKGAENLPHKLSIIKCDLIVNIKELIINNY